LRSFYVFSELRWNVISRLVDAQTHTQPSTTFIIMNTVESMPGRRLATI